MRAEAPGHRYETKKVEISHRREADVRFALRLECRLTVRVRDREGAPLPSHVVWVESPDGRSSGKTDGRGVLVFERLLPGVCGAWVTVGERTFRSPVVKPAGGESAEVEIVVDSPPR